MNAPSATGIASRRASSATISPYRTFYKAWGITLRLARKPAVCQAVSADLNNRSSVHEKAALALLPGGFYL
ncbi:hypothetical protein [Acidovorax sp. T1]|uniref:hypothetical protein n=1 Tax=Acidovorax sp. T1 TaxID=1858609 RepID=UPI0012F99149|nr:hypothetical protein [Acidovorax sp. T1]